MLSTVFAASDNGGAALGFLGLFYVALLVFAVVTMWRVYEKAGEAGWKCLIPLYNSYTMCRIAGRNGWWFLAMLIPFVNIVVLAVISIDLAKHFGKDAVFGIVGLFLFSIIGYAIIAFGDAQYVGTKHA